MKSNFEPSHHSMQCLLNFQKYVNFLTYLVGISQKPQIEIEIKIEIIYNTVCFISTVTFHDNVAPKVLKIIQFCKKYLKDNTLAFNVHQFLGLFDKNWTLLSHS